jgi:hypothetical protein
LTETSKSRPWNIHKKYLTFPEADTARKTLISKGFETRVVRRGQDDTFDVKKRSPETETKTKPKKNKKPQKKTQ